MELIEGQIIVLKYLFLMFKLTVSVISSKDGNARFTKVPLSFV